MNVLTEPFVYKKPVFISPPDMIGWDYLVFDLNYDVQVEKIRDTRTLLSETIAIMPPYPIIFPVPDRASQELLNQVKGLGFFWIPNLSLQEINALEINAKGVIYASPLEIEEGLILHINLSSRGRNN